MGDVRFNPFLERVKRASDRLAAIRELTDEQVVAALAAASRDGDPYLANILASTAMNRVRRKATIVDTAPDGMVELDADGRLVSMNPSAERLLGWSEEELRGKPAHELLQVREGGNGEPHDLLRTVREARPVHSADAVLVRKDGRHLSVAYSSAPVLRDNEFEGAVIVFRDVTERKARERLRAMRAAVLQVLGTAETLEGAVERLLRIVGEEMGWEAGTFWVVQPGEAQLRPIGFWSSKPDGLPHLERATRTATSQIGEGIAGQVWQSAEAWWTSDFQAVDAVRFPRVAAASLDGLRSAFALPCPVVKRPTAVMDFFSRQPIVPDQDLLDALTSIGREVGQFVERRRAEERLRESVALKNGILESALDAVVTIDHEGRVLDFNPAAVRMFGFEISEVLGRNLYETIVPERFREAHRRGMARYLATREARVLGRLLELPAVRKNGEEFPTELYIVRVEGAEPPIFTSHMRDITERKRLQLELHASEQKYRKLFESDPEPMLVTDAQRIITECNAAFTRLLGYTTADLRGHPTAVLYADPALHAGVGARFAERSSGEPFAEDMDLRAKNGEIVRATVRLMRIDDDDGQPLSYLGKVLARDS